MENIKEEKAREYAENIYLPEQRNTFDFRMCKKDFEAGFEAGKQERDREQIEKLKEKMRDSLENRGNLHYLTLAYKIAIQELENLSK